MIRIEAFQIAEVINIKKFKAEFTAQPHTGSTADLFFILENNQFLYVFNYGVVVFAGFDNVQKSDFLRFVKPFSEYPVEDKFVEDYSVEFDEKEQKPVFKDNLVILPLFTENAMRIVMLNIGQSVALDYYEQLCHDILYSTKIYTDQLELYGALKISKKSLLKFIGQILNVKNSIVDNIYILDDPTIVWDDEYLAQINRGLKDTFDIQLRFRDLDYKLRIVEDNLKLFRDLLQHRESNRLEWIIIILILIEVVNLLGERFLHLF